MTYVRSKLPYWLVLTRWLTRDSSATNWIPSSFWRAKSSLIFINLPIVVFVLKNGYYRLAILSLTYIRDVWHKFSYDCFIITKSDWTCSNMSSPRGLCLKSICSVYDSCNTEQLVSITFVTLASTDVWVTFEVIFNVRDVARISTGKPNFMVSITYTVSRIWIAYRQTHGL